jgi:hypothetical protein
MADGDDTLRKKESEIGASLREGDSLKERAQQAADNFKESYRAVSDQAIIARRYTSSMVENLEATARKNPLLTVLSALGIGIALGSMRRR